MADSVTKAGPSTWYWYHLKPADLAVQTHPPKDTTLSLIWKGGLDIHRLGECFKRCAKKIGFHPETECRIWMMTPEGSQHVDIISIRKLSQAAGELTKRSSYVCFELWPTGVPSIEEVGCKPVFAIWSNLDDKADSLEELQQCVGIRLLPDHLFLIEKELSAVVNEISSRYFPSGSYKREAVLENLQRVRSELPTLADPV